MRHGPIRVLWAALLVLPAGGLVPASARGAIIGLDAAHGFDATGVPGTGSLFDDFRATITGLGHSIVTVSSFEAADLAGLDAVILTMPYAQNAHSGYSAGEIAAVESFVNGGGGMLVMAEGGGGLQPANLNALVAPYGITYAINATEDLGHTVTDLVAHPVTAGVGSFGVDYQLRITTAGPSTDLTVNGGADDALSVHGGPQRAVFLSDTSIFMDSEGVPPSDRPLSFDDNLPLLENIIGYIVPEPSTLVLLAFAGTGLFIRRRT